MQIVGQRGERVRLVPPDRALHLENALLWLNDPEITATIKLIWASADARRRSSSSRSRPAATATSSGRSSTKRAGISALSVCTRSTGETVGPLVDSLSESDRPGAGAMRPMRLDVRSRFAFGELGLHRIEGHTMNPAMKRVYEKCGYRSRGNCASEILARRPLARRGSLRSARTGRPWRFRVSNGPPPCVKRAGKSRALAPGGSGAGGRRPDGVFE